MVQFLRRGFDEQAHTEHVPWTGLVELRAGLFQRFFGVRRLKEHLGKPGLILAVFGAEIRKLAEIDLQQIAGKNFILPVQAEPRQDGIARVWSGLRSDGKLELSEDWHSYQTRQGLVDTIRSVALQLNASLNSGRFCRTPFTRNSPGECGSVWAFTRRD